ncbi:hypothetical protein FA13DRAFT_1803900 [Coprinellus micaceus]|uniref:G domain-containing protein n=1 Tax=Coprinellus micaceus TaxID=71717 RepID=A0A4Y7SAE8_COPMI|nr:hypothetical protein FA13DRAFT_1803900 [Coprinellus micaceus]
MPMETTMEDLITKKSGIIILLLGRSGAGKSHFINVAAGKKIASVSGSLTADKNELVVQHFTIDNRQPRNPNSPDKLILVDTPGFDNYYREVNDATILQRISEWLTSRCSLDARFGGVIYFHDITQDRGAMEYNHTWPAAYLTDPEPVRHLLLATAKWDRVPAHPHAANYEEREDILSRTVWSRMLARGARVARFANTTDSAWMVLSQLLELQPLDLHILQKDLMRIKSRGQVKGFGKKKTFFSWMAGLLSKLFMSK